MSSFIYPLYLVEEAYIHFLTSHTPIRLFPAGNNGRIMIASSCEGMWSKASFFPRNLLGFFVFLEKVLCIYCGGRHGIAEKVMMSAMPYRFISGRMTFAMEHSLTCVNCIASPHMSMPSTNARCLARCVLLWKRTCAPCCSCAHATTEKMLLRNIYIYIYIYIYIHVISFHIPWLELAQSMIILIWWSLAGSERVNEWKLQSVTQP